MNQIMSHVRSRRRVITFIVVGAFCTGVQWVLLVLFVEMGIEKHASNAIGFIGSTQVNFVLSYHVTHGDRKGNGKRISRKLFRYNLLATTLLVTNTIAFSLALNLLPIPYLWAGVLGGIGTFVGMVINYQVGLKRIFIPTETTPESIPLPLTQEGEA